MKILLVRHAEPDYTIDSLTPKGRREAELLSRRLCKLDIKNFYVSPQGRARDTASYTLSKLNRTAEVLPWLAEFRGRCFNPAERASGHSLGLSSTGMERAPRVLSAECVAEKSAGSGWHGTGHLG